jgi:ATP-dependent Lon protease
MIIPVTVGRERSIAAAQHALRNQRQVGILMQRESGVADPVAIDLYRIGTIANIIRYVTAPDGSHHLVCQGEERFEIAEFLKGWPFLVARIQRIPDTSVVPLTSETEARFLHLRTQALEALELLPQAPQQLVEAVQSANSPGALADLVASYMDENSEEKQSILETIDVAHEWRRFPEFLPIESKYCVSRKRLASKPR